MTVTDQNIIVNMGGGGKFGGRHQRHYPVWKDDNGIEYVSVNGHSWVKLVDQDFAASPRETVAR